MWKASESTVSLFGIESDGAWILIIGLLILGVIIHFMVKYFVLPRYRRPRYIANIVGISLAIVTVFGASFAWDSVFKKRHRDRFQVMFGLKEDPKDVGYNMHQALSAIGSGGWSGKGYLQGTLSNEKFKHVPEQSTDFIFCSIAEEWGFFGSIVLIAVYLALLIRIILVTERQRSKYTRIFGYCTASILFFHFMINLGMVIGLAPVIGIPLPFLSKGGVGNYGILSTDFHFTAD